MMTITESETMPSETDITEAAAKENHVHRPKGKEVEPQMSDEKPPPYYKRESEHIHLPNIPNLEHSKHHSNKPHHTEEEQKHVKHRDKSEVKSDNHSHPPAPELDLFIGHAPIASVTEQHQQPHHQPIPHHQTQSHHQAPAHAPPQPIKHHPVPLHDGKQLPSLQGSFSNTTYQQQQHQTQIQKQLLLQQQQSQSISQGPKMQYLQPIAHATGSDKQNNNEPAVLQVVQSNDSISTSASSVKESKRRSIHEKKVAEAVLARARRIQQVGPAGDLKRNPMVGHKQVGRIHGVPGQGAAAAADPMMFGVVGKNAPNNNSTKFPVLSFAPPQNGGQSMGISNNNNGQNNLPPLHNHDMESKSKYKFAQNQIPKESVMLPSLTDKTHQLKLNAAPAAIDANSTNLPALKRK
ncbi:hypothetical protein BCR33DRAFT_448019 [Rhizoclosmatium globosum]|uniref:Uncharacterized protein n=1 Tax=Rhizoclosmatium globosum TaxID=329046 RepID=A0A1Y2BSA0_9FUNG|nr:hypothetical protein BCR33DRAFT_448019 [Rhizoclosmatium globosum]|eukprot:ORY37613.1 hypothetical protein BCR33DRAFT_448019 [Rhizoclosmatium globosum]